MTSLRWCFTINNPTDDEEQRLVDFLSEGDVTYGVFGREVGSSGTPHLQGFVILGHSNRLSFLRNNLCARGHYEKARGTSQQAADYCKKDGDFEEFGTFPRSQGKRSDLEELIKWCDEFAEEHGRPASSPDIAKHQPHAYLKYPRFSRMCTLRNPRRALEFGDPRDWQVDMAARLNAEPEDDRTIDFIVDEEGEKGKTWFCRWMLTNNENVQVLGVGKANDIKHMIDDTKRIYMFNVARGQMEFLSYHVLEGLKDRLITSGKWHGRELRWEKQNHVVVLCNEFPDETKLTRGRINIINLNA